MFFYSDFYQANLDATKVIDLIETQQVTVYDDAGTDRTADCLVGAYFAKGVAQGYLGVIFDRGIIVDDVSLDVRDFPHSYTDLIENGIAHLEKTLQLIAATPSLRFDFLTGVTISRNDLVKLTNSLAARILSSVARDKVEAQALGNAHWSKVLDYASRGFDADFLITTVVGGYYNALVDVLERPYGGASYVPVDIKIPYLADKHHGTPNGYPIDNSIILAPIESDDQRFYEYFAYTSNFGILLEARGRNLFSNYIRTRWMHPERATLNVQLELIGVDTYTFGGKDFAGERGIYGELGTAANNGWKPSL